MCGIVGYTGNSQAAPILLHGLSRLEYRGYDSAGIAVRDGDKNTEIIKAKGRLKVLAEKTRCFEKDKFGHITGDRPQVVGSWLYYKDAETKETVCIELN